MDSIMSPMYPYLSPATRSIEDSIIKAQFQQKQMQEKEVKLLQMLDNQQQRALQQANGVLNKYAANNNNLNNNSTGLAAGKVRQMFEERRKGGGNLNSTNGRGLVGIDKSYPLEPIVTPPTKSRTSSSKSDPVAPSKRNTIAPPLPRPSNLGSSNKPVREVSKPSSPVTSSTAAQQPPQRSRVTPTNKVPSKPPSRAKTPILSPSMSPSPKSPSPSVEYPPVAKTTKYSDYANELDKRESSLSNKLKALDINPPSANSNNKNPSASSSLRKSASPQKIAATTTAKSTPIKKKPIAKSSSGPPAGLDECKMCGRYFAPDRIAKHESICKKVATKKRKVFDPTKMRMQGTEAEPYIRIVSAKASKKPAAAAKPKKVDWRKKHEDFIATIRAAKEYQTHVARGLDPKDLPPPPESDYSDFIQCPYCNRKFSEGAAERHIPKCKNIKSNKK